MGHRFLIMNEIEAIKKRLAAVEKRLDAVDVGGAALLKRSGRNTYTILFRRDTSENWEKENPILAYGEPGYDKDTGMLKIGDGVTRWKALQ